MQISKIIDDFFAPFFELKGGALQNDWLQLVRENVILDSDARYFDWTASGLAHAQIEKRISQILPFYANTHSFSATHSKLMSALYEEARFSLKKSLDLDEEFALIACGSGASGAIKKLQEILGIYAPQRTKARFENLDSEILQKINLPQVFITSYEHHSVEISLRQGLCALHKIKLDKNGRFDFDDFEKKLQNLKAQNPDSETFGFFNSASNVTGILSDYKRIFELFKTYFPRSIIALDAASASPHIGIDSKFFDAAFFAPHKLLGGIQSPGLLAVKKNLLDEIPTFAGGGTIEYANDFGALFVDEPQRREEAGTPQILGLLRAALAYKLRDEITLRNIKMREKVLRQIFLNELKKIPAVSIYGVDFQNLNSENLSIVSFNVACVSPLELSSLLSRNFGIQTRAGCSCAGPYGHYLMDLENLKLDSENDKKIVCDLLNNPQKRPGWVRVSLHYTHSLDDVEYLLESINKCIKILRSF